MLLDEEIEVVINSRNKKYLEGLGYNISKYEKQNINGILQVPRGTKIKINILDLQRQSTIKIRVLCDYCEKNISMKQYNQYLDCKKIIDKDCCNNSRCMTLKRNEINLKKYGHENPLQREDIKEKEKQTNLKRYGYENVFQNKEIKEKSKNTLIQKYNIENISQSKEFQDKKKLTFINQFGVDNPLKNKEILNKVICTNLVRYGVPHPMMNEKVKLKSKQTFIRKYGVSSLMKIPSICNERIKKGLITFYENNNTNAKASTQQKYLNSILHGELNYPVQRCSLDICFPSEYIYIEYNGSGHNTKVKCKEITQEQFNQKELERGYFLSKLGWKRIQIISTSQYDWLPQDDVLLKMINEAKQYLNIGHSWIEYNIDEGKVKCSQNENIYDFGELRRIKK